MKKRKNQLIFSLLNKSRSSWSNENDIDFRWSGVQKEYKEDIALISFIKNKFKNTNEEFFSKK